MANLGKSYDTDTIPQDDAFAPLPAGWTRVRITETDVRRNKTDTGSYMWLKMTLTGPDYAGRVVFANINLEHISETAAKIGNTQMGQLLRACGMKASRDSDDFLGKEIEVKLTIKAETPEYPAGNEVKGYREAPGAQHQNAAATPPWQRSQAAGGATPGAPKQQAAARQAPPWGGQQQAPAARQAPPWGGQQQAPAGRQAPLLGGQQQGPAERQAHHDDRQQSFPDPTPDNGVVYGDSEDDIPF